MTRYLLSERQYKTLHGGAPLLVCVPQPDRSSLEADRAGELQAARKALPLDYLYVLDAAPALVTVRQWTGPRQQPSGLADVLGEIERDPQAPLRPGYVRARQLVLLATVHSSITPPTKDAVGPVWPADIVPEGETVGLFRAARESRAEGQERGE
jgi:hypothetical protein